MSRKIYGYLILSALFVMVFLASIFVIGISYTLIAFSGGIAFTYIASYAVDLIG
tara:strand:+ start:566 stop:727 length:162 start_codon:yes stop_codon:yes gene_type:complete